MITNDAIVDAVTKTGEIGTQSQCSESYKEWATSLEQRYKETSGLEDRSSFKIFYSHLHPYPLLVLGLNPGGDPAHPDQLLAASETFYEQWEHDYVRFRRNSAYALAGPMCEVLSRLLGAEDPDILRQVPVSNVVFQRSKSMDNLKNL